MLGYSGHLLELARGVLTAVGHVAARATWPWREEGCALSECGSWGGGGAVERERDRDRERERGREFL